MDPTNPTSSLIRSLQIVPLSQERLRALSVVSINREQIRDQLGHPLPNGLYDPRMGPVGDKHAQCPTCSLSSQHCPGHFGHIDLCLPVYNPIMFDQMFTLLQQSCLYCGRMRVGSLKCCVVQVKLALVGAGLVVEARGVDDLLLQLLGDSNSKDFDDDMNDEAVEEGKAPSSKAVTQQAIMVKLKEHCARLLSSSNKNSSTNNVTLSQQEYRQETINQFMHSATSTSNKCAHCQGYLPGLYKHAGTKIFMRPLRHSQQQIMDAKGMSIQLETDISTDADSVIESVADGAEKDDEEHNDDAVVKHKAKYLTPLHVYEHLRILFKHERPLLNLIYSSSLASSSTAASNVKHSNNSNTSMNSCTPSHKQFFMHVVGVPPSRFRPPSVFGGDQFDHPQNIVLGQIIQLNNQLALGCAQTNKNPSSRALDGKDPSTNDISAAAQDVQFKMDTGRALASLPSFKQIITTWLGLQEQVNAFHSAPSTPAQPTVSGIKQLLEKKEGLFRKHMMGKRVNYAARSVISPDPFIGVDEVGVPLVFAQQLTVPTPVTPMNHGEMMAAVERGSGQWPGAESVQMEDGSVVRLEGLSLEGRRALANQLLGGGALFSNLKKNSLHQPGTAFAGTQPKIVRRHVVNGDYLLLNRQPTLHKPSILAMRARVLPGEKTIRLHYANCNTFNADFDGDEMNMHLPQGEMAKAEARVIVQANEQYLVPTDGSPLRGLIQDHIVSAVLLTMKETMMGREPFQQLIMASLDTHQTSGASNFSKDIVLPPPTILHPLPLWTGKQVITTILLNLCTNPPTISASATKVKAALWSPSHSAEATVCIHAGHLLHGCLDKSQIGASKHGLIHAVYECEGGQVAGRLLTSLGRCMTAFDQQQIGFTCRMDDLVLMAAAEDEREGLIAGSHGAGLKVIKDYTKFEHDSNLGVLAVNMEKIVRNDQLLVGLDARMKQEMNGHTSKIIETCLPHGQARPFPINNMSLMTLTGAKGSMVNFSQIAGLLGQQELEGRRVPVMVSGKSLPSFPPWDPRPRAGGFISQRFYSGIRVQEFFFHCMAGREGLIDTAVKTSRSGYLQRCLVKHLEALQVTHDGSVRDGDGSIVQFLYGEDGLDVCKTGYLQEFGFCKDNLHPPASIPHRDPRELLEDIEGPKYLNCTAALKAQKKAVKKPEKYTPVQSRFSPHLFLGACSEAYWKQLSQYCSSSGGSDEEKKKLFTTMLTKYNRSLVEAGEPVGILAAQSIGEPSTQMTLNTFHFAGFGAKNVTLGIPRLREIVMMASKKIATPTVSLACTLAAPKGAEKEKKGNKKASSKEGLATTIHYWARHFSKTTLKQTIHSINITQGTNNRGQTLYTLTLVFDQAALGGEGAVDIGAVRECVEGDFVRMVVGECERRLRKYYGAVVNGGGSVVDAAGDDDSKAPTFMQHAATSSGEDQEEASSDKVKESDGEGDSDSDSAEESDDDGGRSDTAEVAENEAATARAKSSAFIKKCNLVKECTHHENHSCITLAFPPSTPSLLMIDVVEMVVGEAVVREIDGIGLCVGEEEGEVLAANDQDEVARRKAQLTCEGSNIKALWDAVMHAQYASSHTRTGTSPIFDINKLYSNDIAAILNTYGVEAARSTLVKEISSVFAVYGIQVDTRHLTLIADYMTQGGQYRPFSRTGMQAHWSPLGQMTFETSFGFLRAAVLGGLGDDLRGPSAQLIVGGVVGAGSGACEILVPIGDATQGAGKEH